MTVTETEEVGQDFARLMSGAADAAAPEVDPEAPFGWTTDRETGERRPKRSPGRPRKSASAEELLAGEPLTKPEDGAPASGGSQPAPAAPGKEPPMPKGGVIATGVNRLYRRAGKIVRAMDHDLGTAIIECTRDEDGDGQTVGEAWETLAKANPRIRAFILRILAGGAWSDLLMAHAPIAMALMMKPAVMRLLPFKRLVDSFLESDEDTEPGDLRPADAQQMADMATAQAQRMAERAGFGQLPPDVVAAARAQAEQLAARHNGPPGGAPPGLTRTQRPRQSRAKRGNR